MNEIRGKKGGEGGIGRWPLTLQEALGGLKWAPIWYGNVVMVFWILNIFREALLPKIKNGNDS